MKIRQATSEDSKELEALATQYNFESHRNYNEMINDNKIIFFVICDENIIHGFSGIKYENWNNTIKIINIFIRPEKRRSGYAKLLIENIILFSKTTSYRCIIAEAPSNNPVLNLYQSSGFRKCGYNDRYYNNNDEEVAIFLAYDLR